MERHGLNVKAIPNRREVYSENSYDFQPNGVKGLWDYSPSQLVFYENKGFKQTAGR